MLIHAGIKFMLIKGALVVECQCKIWSIKQTRDFVLNINVWPIGAWILSESPLSQRWAFISVTFCNICLGGVSKNTYELLNLRALKFSLANKIHIFQCMGKIFCVEFQRYPLKFHTKYLTHTLKDMIFIQHWNLRFKSSYAFLKHHPGVTQIIGVVWTHFINTFWTTLFQYLASLLT